MVRDGVIVLVLVQVDDFLCATNQPAWFDKFYTEVNKLYKFNRTSSTEFLQMTVNRTEDFIEL